LVQSTDYGLFFIPSPPHTKLKTLISSKWHANELIYCAQYELMNDESGNNLIPQVSEIQEVKWFSLQEAIDMWTEDAKR
jgi:NADH pyrophosphatase NudC (nudix superfamily)